MLIDTARTQLGFKAGPNRVQPFGPHGLAWEGYAIDWLLAQENLTTGTKHASTVQALAYYQGHGKIRLKSRVNDLVFYADSTEQNGQPRIGIVSAVKPHGEFRAIEFEVASGLPRASTDRIGIFERTRYTPDVLAFARPRYRQAVSQAPQLDVPRINLSQLTTGKPHISVSLVQIALGRTGWLSNATRGVWDGPTRAAFAACQRRHGRVGLKYGVPDLETLTALGDESGIFTTRK